MPKHRKVEIRFWMCSGGVQETCLLGGEFLVGQRTVVVEIGQPLEVVDAFPVMP